MTMGLGSQVVTVIPRTRVKHGDYVEGEPTDYCGCSVQPIDSTEQLLNGVAVQERWRFFGPANFPTSTDNIVMVDGARMHVVGNFQLWKDLDGCPSHVTGLLQRFQG